MNAAALVFGGPSDGEFYASRSSRLVAFVVPLMYQPVAGPPDATSAAPLETYEYSLEKFAWRSWQDVMWWWAWIPAREPDRAEQIERVEGSLRLIAKLAESAMFAPAGGGSPFARRVDPWRDDHDGYVAGFAGQPVSECPYLPTDESGFHWRQGWLRGASEHHHRSGTFGAGGPVHRRDSAAYWDDRFAPGDELERLQRELAPPEVVVEPFTDSSTAGPPRAAEPFDELERLQRLQLAADATSAAERFQQPDGGAAAEHVRRRRACGSPEASQPGRAATSVEAAWRVPPSWRVRRQGVPAVRVGWPCVAGDGGGGGARAEPRARPGGLTAATPRSRRTWRRCTARPRSTPSTGVVRSRSTPCSSAGGRDFRAVDTASPIASFGGEPPRNAV